MAVITPDMIRRVALNTWLPGEERYDHSRPDVDVVPPEPEPAPEPQKPKVTPKERSALRDAELLIPGGIQQRLRRAFSPKGLNFFLFYIEMKKIELGVIPFPDDLKVQFTKTLYQLNQITSPVDHRGISPPIVNMLALAKPELISLFTRMANNPDRTVLWRQFNETYVPLIIEVAKDKGIYLKALSRGTEKWATFRSMLEKQEATEKLREEDPDSYAAIIRADTTLQERRQKVISDIAKAGLDLKRTKLRGRWIVEIGVDKVTGEERVYGLDGSVLPVQEYIEKKEAQDVARAKAAKVPVRTQVPLRNLKVVSDDDLAALEGQTEWMSISDDLAKSGQLTRIFPTKVKYQTDKDEKGVPTSMGVRVVTNGRYKGCQLDDLINSEGRLIEGTAYSYNPRAREHQVPVRIDPAQREPYVTVADTLVRKEGQLRNVKQLYISISGESEFAELRNVMKALAINAQADKGYVGTRPLGTSISTVRWAQYGNLEHKAQELLKLAKEKSDAGTVRSAQGMLTFLRSHADKDSKDWSQTDTSDFERRKRVLAEAFKKYEVKGSRQMGFYFSPKDFGIIRDAMQGMSVSTEALAMLQRYYKDLAYAEEATARENLVGYTMPYLEGFKRTPILDKNKEPVLDAQGKPKYIELLVKQQQALAWLAASGDKGVCALDTGVGKTLVCIASMQKYIRDGMLTEDASYTTERGKEVKTNGRFLYVGPKDLIGNVISEIKFFLSEEPSKDLRSRVDDIGYPEFARAMETKRVPPSLAKSSPYWKARLEEARKKPGARRAQEEVPAAPAPLEPAPAPTAPSPFMPASGVPKKKDPAPAIWDPQQYVAIFFDEAHKLSHPDTKVSKAAQSLWHPRKVLLTASPIEKNPMEAYVLAAIATNKPLRGKAGKDNALEMRRFKKRFCETLGGRIMGVQQDVEVKRELHTWVKRNIFFADKKDIEEFTLPELRQKPTVVEMPEDVEVAYRDVTSQFAKVMKGLVMKFRDRGKVPGLDRVEVDPTTGEIIKRVPSVNEAKLPEVEQMFGKIFQPIVHLMDLLANDPAQGFQELANVIEHGGFVDAKGVLKKVHENFKPILAIWQKRYSPDALRARAATMPNPKLQVASERIMEKITNTEGKSRSIIFAEDSKLCMTAGKHFAKTIPGVHCVALRESIHLFDAEGEITEIKLEISSTILDQVEKNLEKRQEFLKKTGGVGIHTFPFNARVARRYPQLPRHDKFNPHSTKGEWKTFCFKELIGPREDIKTITLEAQVYQYGQNFQFADTVVHLDRNKWNSESMKQRTARAWRQKQKNPVDEIIIDATYNTKGQAADPRFGDFDKTLDEIRGYFQELEGELFDRIIKDAQSTELGVEWAEMQKKKAQNIRIDKKTFELIMSPYVERTRTQ